MQENVVTKAEVEQGDYIQKLNGLEEQISGIKSQLESLSKATPSNKVSMIVFSGDLDKVLASFVIATGAVDMGMEVVGQPGSGTSAQVVTDVEALWRCGLAEQIHSVADRRCQLA